MSYTSIGDVVRKDPQFDKLVPPNARIEVLASGFVWAEGPVWVPRDGGFLLFSDIPRNSIMIWSESNGLNLFLKPSGYTGVAEYGREPGSNGLLLDSAGRLVCCEHGDRRLSVMTWDGSKMTLADRWQGQRFNSPNDAALHSSGAIYFTDPYYGLPELDKDSRRELDFCGVFRVAPEGTVTLLTKELPHPNGIAFSPDESTLYVAQSDPKNPAIWVFDVQADGTISNRRVFYDANADFGRLKGIPDGMSVDAQGHLFATGPGGVLVVSPDGKLLGRIDTGESTANCCWGGDGSMLYMTAHNYLCRVQTNTRGAGW